MSLELNKKDFTKKQQNILQEINAWGYRKSIVMKAYERDKKRAVQQGIPAGVVREAFNAGKKDKEIKFNTRAKRLKERKKDESGKKIRGSGT